MKKQNHTQPSLQKRVSPVRDNIDVMVDTAWHLTLNSLWPHMESAKYEEVEIKKIIRKRIVRQDPQKSYIEYCERILLCWKIVSEEYAFGQMETPIEWFNSKNENGFKNSGIFYKLLQRSRKRTPNAHFEIRTLAKALLEMSQTPLRATFNYWKNWFAENYAYDEYILFYMCCVKNSNNFKK